MALMGVQVSASGGATATLPLPMNLLLDPFLARFIRRMSARAFPSCFSLPYSQSLDVRGSLVDADCTTNL